MKTKSFRQQIADAMQVGADRIVAHKDGTVSVKRSFFYHHGMDSQKWADRVCGECAKAGIAAQVVSHREDWKAWPKTSYFVVTVRASVETVRTVNE